MDEEFFFVFVEGVVGGSDGFKFCLVGFEGESGSWGSVYSSGSCECG